MNKIHTINLVLISALSACSISAVAAPQNYYSNGQPQAPVPPVTSSSSQTNEQSSGGYTSGSNKPVPPVNRSNSGAHYGRHPAPLPPVTRSNVPPASNSGAHYGSHPVPQVNSNSGAHYGSHKKHRASVFGISINVPEVGEFVEEDTYFVPAHPARGWEPQWLNVSAGAPLPVDTVIGGGEANRSLYVCRANFRGGLHPGKLVSGRCNIGWGGKEIAVNRYQVLVSHNTLSWSGAQYGDIPPGAIPGGFENGQPLFICQAQYHGGMHPGKVVGESCNITWGGREVGLPYYNVLVG